MDRRSDLKAATLKIFHHHLYELAKGLRPLVMMTLTGEECGVVVAELLASCTPHHVQRVCRNKANVVFGRPAAVATARRLLERCLCELTDEEDFMLGMLLGYDREQQCLRYLARKASTDVDLVESVRARAEVLH